MCVCVCTQAVVAADVELMGLREEEKELLERLEHPPADAIQVCVCVCACVCVRMCDHAFASTTERIA